MTRIKPENTQAILIGASEFDNDSLESLPNVKTNLLALNRLLIEVVGIDKNKIRMMLDWNNSSDITSKIIQIVPNASDTMIVYYAGHGIPQPFDLYLATKNTQCKEPEYTGAIPSKQLVNLVIKKAKAKNIIFIIDCCFSARIREGEIKSKEGQQVFFITAAPSLQTAKDESPEDTNYTAFTHELLVILEQGIKNAGEFLTLQDISNQLIKQLKAQNLPEPQLSSYGQPDKLEICKNLDYQNTKSSQQERKPDVESIKPVETPTISLTQAQINAYLDNILLDAEELDKRYIDLSATTESKTVPPPTTWSRDIIPPSFHILDKQFNPELGKTKSLNAISEALKLHKCFVLLGAPGAGKSMTLKKLQLDRAKLAQQNPEVRIPILINLALWHDDIIDLQQFLNIQLQAVPFVPLDRTLILLDGLNEMSSKKYVERVKMFEKWLQIHPKLSVIIGCRERHYQQSKKLPLPTVQIAPFDNKRIQLFLQAYLGSAAATQLLSQLGPLEPQQRSARDLIHLADNPFLLFMICYVYTQNQEQLPSSRGQLFQRFVQVLHKREQDQGTTAGISYQDFVYGLSEMAFAMQRHRSSTSVHTAWAEKQIPAKFSVEALWRLGREASLLSFLKEEERMVQFAHQLILEYLAAEGLRRRFSELSKYIKIPRFFRNKRGSGAWDEVIYTLVGITDVNQFLVQLAEIDPFLAVDCFEHVPQGIEVTDETRRFITRQLIDLLGSKNPQAREAAVSKVVQLGSITLSYLIDLLETGNKVSKRASLKALAQFDDEPLAIKAIVLALENNKWVRKDAKAILDRMESSKFEFLAPDENATAILFKNQLSINNLSNDNNIDATIKSLIIQALSSTEKNVRQNARKNLAKLADNQVINIIIEALDDQSSLIRKKAATTLRVLENTSECTRIVKALMDNLDDPYPEVRGATITALAKLGDASIVDKLIPGLQDEDPINRGSTITALAKLGDARIVDKLIPCLQDEASDVRGSAITALAKLGDARIVDKLIPCLQDEASDVRGSAITALAQLGDASIVDKLIPYLQDKNSIIRGTTINALGKLGDASIVDKLIPYLQDEEPIIRGSTITALAKLGDASIVEKLIPFLQDEDSIVIFSAKAALINLGYDPDTLIKSLNL